MKSLLLYLVIFNAAGFALMLADKLRAMRKEWRIPEALLILVAIVGGSVGVLLGIHLCHHKTRHAVVCIGVPVIIAIQIILALAGMLFLP